MSLWLPTLLWSAAAFLVSGVLVSDEDYVKPLEGHGHRSEERSGRKTVPIERRLNPCAKCVKLGDAKTHKGTCTAGTDGWCSTPDDERYCSLPSSKKWEGKVKTCEAPSKPSTDKTPKPVKATTTTTTTTRAQSEDSADVTTTASVGSTTKATVTPAMSAFLKTLKNATEVSCADACVANGDAWEQLQMARRGDVTTFTCNCTKAPIVVQCTGFPFLECCKDKCPGADCGDKPEGWSCPKEDGCNGEPLCKEWLSAHNVFRCMHDVPPVTWNSDVFAGTKAYFESVKVMDHSKSYDLAPPQGPCGENLMQGTGTYNTMDTVGMWYSEIKDCASFPGCLQDEASGDVGHFTAMIWNGAREIGCMNNSFNLWACRYKANDYKNCRTPNFGDDEHYRANVFAAVKKQPECEAAVKKCSVELPIEEANYDPATHLASEDEVKSHPGATWMNNSVGGQGADPSKLGPKGNADASVGAAVTDKEDTGADGDKADANGKKQGRAEVRDSSTSGTVDDALKKPLAAYGP